MGLRFFYRCWKPSHVSFFIHRQQDAVLLREVGVDRENGIGEWVRGMDKWEWIKRNGLKGNGVRPVDEQGR